MPDPIVEKGTSAGKNIDPLLTSSDMDKEDQTNDDTGADAGDAFEELSQDDVDQLMNTTSANPDEPADDGYENDMELISQEDIDRLMNSSYPSDDAVEPPPDDSKTALDDVSPDEDFGALSQDDIDSLMGLASPEEPSDEPPDEEDMLLIPQSDIDTLLGEETIDSGVEAEKETADEHTRLMVEADGGQDIIPDDDYIIDETEAVDIEGCLVTQTAIDNLIQPSDQDSLSDEAPVILDDDPDKDFEIPELEPEPLSGEDETGIKEDPVLDDAEDLIKLAFDDEENVTQDDIDALLLETDDEEEDDEENDGEMVISQDDIDTLLMSADQEDEDVLGDLMDDDFDDSLGESFEDEAALESERIDEKDADQFFLSDDDEEQILESMKKKTGDRWYTSKPAIAFASALIVLGISVPLMYFIFFSGGRGGTSPSYSVENLSVEREIEIEIADAPIDTSVMNKNPGNMILKDFVILAPDVSTETAYITADISIDYSDERAYHEISNNLSYYRDLIYQSMGKGLESETGEEPTEAEILGMLETALKKVLPESYIGKVSFTSFKAS